jgi:hypothetical protein
LNLQTVTRTRPDTIAFWLDPQMLVGVLTKLVIVHNAPEATLGATTDFTV